MLLWLAEMSLLMLSVVFAARVRFLHDPDGYRVFLDFAMVRALLVAIFLTVAAADGQDLPETWAKVVQGCIVRLRKALGAEAIQTLARTATTRIAAPWSAARPPSRGRAASGPRPTRHAATTRHSPAGRDAAR